MSLYGIGINDANYVVKPANGAACPFYLNWVSMFDRCYGKIPNVYHGVTVCDEWFTFSAFRAWMKTQDWEGKQLDKDILGTGLIYNPSSCCFVNQRTNNHIRKKKENGLPWGVRPLTKRPGKFKAECNSATGEKVYLGCFNSETEAHKAWQLYKAKVLQDLALQENDKRVSLRLNLMANKILSDFREGKETRNLKNDC